MVATRKRTTSANTELTTDQLIATVEQDNQKLKSSLRARESQIGFLQRELAQATQTIAEMRENSAAQVEAQAARIALLESTNETLKAQLRKRMDSAPAKRAEELEHQLASQYQDLRQAIDQATDLACQRLEEIERLKKQVETQAGENTRLKQETRRAEKNESALLDRARKAEEKTADLAAQIDSLKEQLEESGAAQVEALSIELAQVKADLKRARQIADPKLAGAYSPEYLLGQIDSQQKTLKVLSHRIDELLETNKQVEARACEWQEKHAQAEQRLSELEQTQTQATNDTHQDYRNTLIDKLSKEVGDLRMTVTRQEMHITELQARAQQNAHIAEEEHTQVTTLLEENAHLRTTLAEQEDTPAHCPACEIKDQRIAHLEALKETNERYIMRLQHEDEWLDQLSACDKIEAATKFVIRAMRKATQGKEDSYTQVYRSDIAKATGLQEQAAGRHMNAAVAWNMFGGYRTEEKATVPDTRLGQRTIKKKVLNIAPTKLLERPEDYKRLDGKAHGGSLPRCRRCNGENTLRKVHHTVCLSCGHEDILMPDDARIALDKARALTEDDAPAAVAEATAIFAQAATPAPAQVVEEVTQAEPVELAQVSEIQDELQSDTAPVAALDYARESMTIARRSGFPTLALPGIKIAGESSAWSHWMWMSHPTDEQIRAVYEALTGTKSTDVHDKHHSEPAPESLALSASDIILAYGEHIDYPRVRLSNGYIIPATIVGWRGFVKHQGWQHQQACEDIQARKVQVVDA